MKINTNPISLFAQRVLGQTEDKLRTSLERLSSGLRVNSAKDDAAGLAISGRFTAQVRGTQQAIRNAADAVSMLQTAESALGSSLDAMQRMRELAIQAANATNSSSDRAALQQEVNQLKQEITRVARDTKFNGVQLFVSGQGSINTLNQQEQFIYDGLRNSWLKSAEDMIRTYYGLEGDGAGLKIVLDDTPGPAAAYVSGTTGEAGGLIGNLELHIDLEDFPAANAPHGGSPPFYSDRIIAHEMVHAIMNRTMNMASMPTWFAEGAAEFIHGADERVAGDLALAGSAATLLNNINGAWSGSSAQYSAGYVAVRYMHHTLKANGGDGIRDVMNYLSTNVGATLDDALANLGSSQWANEAAFRADVSGAAGQAFLNAMDLANADTGAIGGLDADGGSIRSATDVVANPNGYTTDPLQGFTEIWDSKVDNANSPLGRQLSFQVGANGSEADRLLVQLGVADAVSLDIHDIDISENPNQAIVKLDKAMDYLNGQRGEMGAYLSRLESTMNVQQQTVETASASRSRILDADYAEETASLVRNQILQQAGMAMVAQANATPRLALELLRG